MSDVVPASSSGPPRTERPTVHPAMEATVKAVKSHASVGVRALRIITIRFSHTQNQLC
jgi:hypothetical protein